MMPFGAWLVVGGALTITLTVAGVVSARPWLSVTVKETVKVPVLLKVTAGFCDVAVLPGENTALAPKFQL